MYIIICLDDNNGLAFNHRRQSQDRIVAEDISKPVGEKKLWTMYVPARCRSQCIFILTYQKKCQS